MSIARVAVLYQAIEPPIVNGVRKPPKPGGYRDSGADIAYSLQLQPDIDVLTATPSPNPNDEDGWCFPDTEEGIMLALEKGATHLWANTVLFASHPLQSSSRIGKYQDLARVFGQPPAMVEKYDDKEFVNNLLRSKGGFTMPRNWSLSKSEDVKSRLRALNLPFPVVVKPIRGRGSYGVRMCTSEDEVIEQIKALFEDSLAIMIEEYLVGEEITITVMPPSEETPRYWAMPIVKRFNHVDGIAPYSGVIAVTFNSTVVPSEDYAKCPSYHEVTRQCEEVAKLLRVTAPIRIDARRFTNDQTSDFALFDINMKPNMTGPGRPGRENQASLTALSAAALGWDYSTLLRSMLLRSHTLRALREAQPGL